jgi:hypothetical protein
VEVADRKSAFDGGIDNTEPFEELQRLGLNPCGFGADVVVSRGVHTTHRHAAAAQFGSGGQPDRPGADDQHVDMLAAHRRSGNAGIT